MLEKDSIHRCAVRGRTNVVKRWEKEIASAAATGQLHPPHLSKSAIVCIRSLRVVPTSLRQGVWPEVGSRVETAIAEAAHPARDRVPTTAPAVVFADKAELLACLARDWTTGELHDRWWWRSLLGNTDVSVAAKQWWLRTPASVPTALTRLLQIDPSVAFLRHFETDEVNILFDRVVETFDLLALKSPRPTRRNFAPPPDRIPSMGTRSSSPAWSYLPPEAGVVVHDINRRLCERRLVAACSVMIHRPAHVRSAAFAEEFQCWTEASQSTDGDFTAAPIPSKSSPTSQLTTRPRRAPAPAAPPFGFSRPIPSPTRESAGPYSVSEYTLIEPERTVGPGSSTVEHGEPPALVRGEPCGPLAAPAALAEPSGERIDTAWGGVFYLVNVALALGLYGDFTSPRSTRLNLPLWDFLELFGARFIGAPFAEDPLPGLLSRLSGRRPEETVGAFFTPPEGVDFERWQDVTAKQLRARLQDALGSQGDDLLAVVFRQRAAVWATTERVDITFSLCEHPIALRLAGLDRDPGWVPAGGRTLAFHYE